MNKKLLDDEIIEVCNNSSSMLEASRKLNISINSLKRRATKLDCYKTNQNWNKGKTFLNDIRIISKYKFDDFFCENSKISRYRLKLLILNENLIEYKCEICNINRWEDKVLSLHLDHINGVRNDNRLENLRFLCPNCHSQTDTYCNKNVSKTFETFTIDEICGFISKSKSMNECLLSMGLINNKINSEKLKSIISSNNVNFIENIVEKKKCDCGKFLKSYNTSGFCRKCLSEKSRKVERPSYIQLLNDLESMTYVSMGRKYGVSDNTIRKWIAKYKKE